MSAIKFDNKPLYNSRITNTYIKLIKRNYNFINVDELLRYSGIEAYQLEDEGHWFTQTQINRFQEKLRLLTGNNNIAREAGSYSASPEALGGIRKYLLGLVSPAGAYSLIGKYVNKFTRSSQYESRKIGNNKVEITVTPNPGIKEEPFQCANRHGYVEAVSKLFNYKLPIIEHPECLFKGDAVCRYIVSWKNSPSVIWKRVRDYSIPFFSIYAILSFFFISPLFTIAVILPASCSVIFAISWYVSGLDGKEWRTAVEHLKDSSDELIEQINLNYDTALMTNEVGQALSKEMDIDGILSSVINVLKKRLDYDRGVVMLATPDRTRLAFRAGFGYTEEQLNLLIDSDFHLDKEDSKGIFVVSFKTKRPFLLNDIDEIKDTLSERSLEFARQMGVKSFICCPIIFEDTSLGILAVDNIKTKRPLLQRDMNLLMGVAPQIGISINNVVLMESKIRQFQSILQVLAATNDARDPITARHSEQVTEYALGICRELGLPHDYSEMIRVASLLHDYGKVGISDSILKKPGRLSFEEREEVKNHVAKTRNILEQIHFEGIYAQVPEIAGAHHEKLDGSGYPNGLKGDEIPLGARIITVADVFEAITSKRHYRDPMPLNAAFATLRMDIGVHYDKDCVEALIKYIKGEKDLTEKLEAGDTVIEPFPGEMKKVAFL